MEVRSYAGSHPDIAPVSPANGGGRARELDLSAAGRRSTPEWGYARTMNPVPGSVPDREGGKTPRPHRHSIRLRHAAAASAIARERPSVMPAHHRRGRAGYDRAVASPRSQVWAALDESMIVRDGPHDSRSPSARHQKGVHCRWSMRGSEHQYGGVGDLPQCAAEKTRKKSTMSARCPQ